ncbi:MAG: hypothetical protein DMD69_13110 [Gemmatimonadetes bacterium]|nr:MAG: hypothetical protein DMD69_13110 [Gemmatimonadota bacterium]
MPEESPRETNGPAAAAMRRNASAALDAAAIRDHDIDVPPRGRGEDLARGADHDSRLGLREGVEQLQRARLLDRIRGAEPQRWR